MCKPNICLYYRYYILYMHTPRSKWACLFLLDTNFRMKKINVYEGEASFCHLAIWL